MGLAAVVHAAGPSQGDSREAVADFVWPPVNLSDGPGYVALADGAFNVSASTVLGAQPIEEISLERTSPTETRIDVTTAGETASFVQTHRPVAEEESADAGDYRTVEMDTGDLEPVVGVTPLMANWAPRGVFMLGPPGSFEVPDDGREGPSDNVRALGKALDLPPSEYRADEPPFTEWRTIGYETPFLYQVHAGCGDGGVDTCREEVRFALDCPNCTFIGGIVRPTPEDELTAWTNGTIQFKGEGWNAVLVFSESQELVFAASWASFHPRLEMLVNPVEARERVFDEIKDRGFEMVSRSSPEFDLDDAWFRPTFSPDAVRPDAATYEWEDEVFRDRANLSGATVIEVSQDARTGEILSVDTRPAGAPSGPEQDVSSDDEERLSTPVGIVVLSAALALGVALRQRR